jgi:hypothetical protein
MSVPLAVDGDTVSIFRGTLCRYEAGVAWHCSSGQARTAVKYSVTAGDNRLEDLRSFKLVGSNDWGYHITVLDSQMNQSWTTGETKTFTFPNAIPFALYRLDVIENNNGQKPIDCGWFEVAEFSLMDAGGANLMRDPGGFVAGSEETWGDYYPLQQKIVPYSSISNPEVIELPGTPPFVARRIFEIKKGTPDDASEIQSKIDSAAAQPAGTPPIVHIPKGTYSINKTLHLPANVEMTLSGDGIYDGGTILLSTTGMPGPTISIDAPSHILVRDIVVEGNEAIYAKVDDKPGSRVTGTLFECAGWGGVICFFPV